MYKAFELKPCEECNGTGDAHHQGHDYDCPDCLGTGHEEPQGRIMNLENDLAEMIKQRNILLETLTDVDLYLEEINFPKEGFIRGYIGESLTKMTGETL